ncbi:MAG: hypothetical protein ACLFRR_06200 [Spirochaetaceae bacterium]
MKGRVLYASIVLAVAVMVVLAGCGSSSAQRMRIQITSPSGRPTVTDASIAVTGIISDPSATVTVDGEKVSVDGEGAFSTDLDLAYGSNRFVVRAEREEGSPTSRTITVTRALELAVESPEASYVSPSPNLVVNGTVSDPTARVFVTGAEVPVDEQGRFSYDLILHYPLTVVPVSAIVDGLDDPVEQQLNVTYESTAS